MSSTKEQHITQGLIGAAILVYAFGDEGRLLAKVIGGAAVARSGYCLWKDWKARQIAGQQQQQQALLPQRPPVDPTQQEPVSRDPETNELGAGLRLVD